MMSAPPAVQMLVSLLVTTMASSSHPSAAGFAHNTCRHFALLMASGWGRPPPPALPPSSKYATYPVLGGMPANTAALKHLHPQAVLEAFQEVRRVGWAVTVERVLLNTATPSRKRSSVFPFCSRFHCQGFALAAAAERAAVLTCLAVFLDALDTVTSAQHALRGNADGDAAMEESPADLRGAGGQQAQADLACAACWHAVHAPLSACGVLPVVQKGPHRWTSLAQLLPSSPHAPCIAATAATGLRG